jgi:hypothetical protein
LATTTATTADIMIGAGKYISFSAHHVCFGSLAAVHVTKVAAALLPKGRESPQGGVSAKGHERHSNGRANRMQLT